LSLEAPTAKEEAMGNASVGLFNRRAGLVRIEEQKKKKEIEITYAGGRGGALAETQKGTLADKIGARK